MSGVQTGTKLERLQALERQVKHEIAVELRRLALDDTGRHRAVTITPRRRGDQDTQDRLTELGVTSKHVKEWAVQKGILTAVRQGRVARWIVEAYAAAHP